MGHVLIPSLTRAGVSLDRGRLYLQSVRQEEEEWWPGLSSWFSADWLLSADGCGDWRAAGQRNEPPARNDDSSVALVIPLHFPV